MKNKQKHLNIKHKKPPNKWLFIYGRIMNHNIQKNIKSKKVRLHITKL